ncbi:hypothetical protein [Lysinibacillus xylanilyticus]|uniref:hypothetical protein n=1 Tax=Lysinibacillus xylanilyticus TaxID=582475 RepID=UPI003D003CC2
MDDLFLIISFLSFAAIIIFAILAVIQFAKKDSQKGKKQIKFTGIAGAIMVVSFIGFGLTSDSSDTTKNDKEKVETATEPKEETPEEKALAEQKAKEEAAAKAKAEEEARLKVEQEASVAVTWQDKVKEIATMDGTSTEKYDAVMLYAKDYPSTEAEIKEFEQYIIAEYKSKNYVADINNAEYMLSNVFRANVINNFYGEDNTPINSFASDFYQNTKYTYRGVDTLDSSAVRSNERQMDKALKEMGK